MPGAAIQKNQSMDKCLSSVETTMDQKDNSRSGKKLNFGKERKVHIRSRKIAVLK